MIYHERPPRHDPGMSVADSLEALDRAIRAGEPGELAAAAVCQAVLVGASASGFVDQLVAALDSMYVAPARADVALALTVDLARRGEIAAWMALRAVRCDELENALVRADEAGIDVRAVVLALPPAPRTSGSVPAIVRWCLRDPDARTRDLVANLALENVTTLVQRLYDKHASLAPWVSRLGEVLTTLRDSPTRARAAQLLRWAVAQGCELDAVVRDALRAALDDDSYHHDPAEEAARALTLAGERGLDRDPRVAVRMGAWHARPSFLGLLDPEPANRRLIARGLLEQIATASRYPSRDELQCLFAELLDPLVVEVLYAVIERGEVAATVVASVEPHGAARHLLEAARAVLARAQPPICRTCRDIPRYSSGRNFTPPAAAQRGLDPPLVLDQEGERTSRCIECGATYRVSCTDASDIYIAYSVELERQPADDPAVVARWRDRLDHPETWARCEAAWNVARAAVNARDTATLDELLGNRDAEVRRETWEAMSRATRLPAKWQHRATMRGLDDPDDAIRSQVARRLAGSGDTTVIVDLLRRDPAVAHATARSLSHEHLKRPEIVQALRARMHAARAQERPDEALESVCRELGRTPDPAIVAEAIDILRGAPPAIQACLLHVVASSPDTSALDDSLAALLRHPDTREGALELLDSRSNAGQPLRVEHLQTLASVLDPDDSNAEALAVFAHAARMTATREPGLAGLYALLAGHGRYDAASELLELAREGLLADAVPHVVELASRTVEGSVRQELVRALIVDARRRGDAALETALVEHAHPGIARQARYALRDGL